MDRIKRERAFATATGITRRRILIGTGALAGLALTSQWSGSVIAADPAPPFFADPFSLGVASGDPLPDGVVLWTRLAPDPLSAGGGLPPHQFPVQWQIATDEHMRHVVQRGTVLATPEWAHSVHVEVRGLEPARWYWYQFRAGSELSPIGRTRTAPALSAALGRFRFAFASCQNWQGGYYAAYRTMAREDLDLVIHLGDYIYEGAIPESGGARGLTLPAPVRSEPTTLEQYRLRYAVYKSDPDLRLAHASFPWLVTWDDHEVENNYADDISQADEPYESPEQFRRRRAAAYQAYYEHQPLRRSSLPSGPDMLLYRRIAFGNLVAFNVLDTRQYRHDQTNCLGEPIVDGYCPSATDPARTLLGDEQERWLLNGLDRSAARWNVLAQQVIFAQKDNNPDPNEANYVGNGDQWDGYKADRDTILRFLQERRPANPVVITGDVHRNYVFDLKADFADPASETVGTEFVGTSISSGGNNKIGQTVYGGTPNDPHQQFFNSNRGYVRCDLTPAQWQADFRVVATVHDPDAPASTLASFVVEDGRPGAERV